MDATSTTNARLYRARYARSVAGGVLIVTAIGMIIASLAAELGPAVLAMGWVVAAAAVLLGQRWVPHVQDPAAQADRLFRRSIQLPMIGISLVAPLSIHCLFMLVVGSTSASLMAELSMWIWISALVVGQAHLTLAWLARRDAGLMTGNTFPTSWKPMAWGALWKTTLASCIPSVVLMGVPPLLTLGTGVLFIPLMYWGALRLTGWERACREWLVLADRTGLDAIPSHSTAWLPPLTGAIDGIRVELSGYRMMSGRMRIELEIGLDAPDLTHLQITTDPSTPAQLRIGESVADAVLRITSISPGDAATLAERMRDPDCYAAMMEVVHGQGATLRRGQIELDITSTTLTPVWEALPQLIDLARLLSRPVASSTVSPAQPARLASPAG